MGDVIGLRDIELIVLAGVLALSLPILSARRRRGRTLAASRVKSGGGALGDRSTPREVSGFELEAIRCRAEFEPIPTAVWSRLSAEERARVGEMGQSRAQRTLVDFIPIEVDDIGGIDE